MIEGYKYLNDLLPQIINYIFKVRKDIYDLRNFYLFENQNPKTKQYGLDCIAYIVSQIWQTFPIEIRNSVLLKTFKHKIKTWLCNPHLCYCCKPYIHHLGFI